MEPDFDLYEFPNGHIGRKTYVSVRGHSRSVPVVYTYKGCDGRNYIHPVYGGTVSPMGSGSQQTIMRDIEPYMSVVDGSYITSRSHLREHIKQHDLIEVGNERIKPREDQPIPNLGRSIKEHLDRVSVMPQREYDARLAELASKR
jgi:hypothetical protein